MTKGLHNLPGLILPKTNKNYTHSYYVYGINLDLKKLKFSRDYILKKLKLRGVPGISPGYTCLHLLPMFQKKIAYGNKGFPWNSNFYKGKVSYKMGTCPNAEYFHKKSFIKFEVCLFDFTKDDINFIIKAFKDVWKELKII